MWRSKCHPVFLKWYDSLSWRGKLRYRISTRGNRWDDWLTVKHEWYGLPDWLYWYDGPWRKLLCVALRAHDPVPDHCGIPDHDYCSTCGKLTPGQARR